MEIDLLVFYTKEWQKFTQSAKFIDHLFSYINRHWVKRELDERHQGVYRIHTVRLHIFRNVPINLRYAYRGFVFFLDGSLNMEKCILFQNK
jgi:hypothetical protein